VRQEPPLPIAVEGDASLAETIAKEIRNALTFTPQIRMVAPQSLPRSEYKSKLVDFSDAT
jgi:phenylacetate-CoA ligase